MTEEIGRINAMPARADIKLKLAYPAPDHLRLQAKVNVTDADLRSQSRLFLVVYENDLRREVTAGENNGRTLQHSFVARVFIGPLSIAEGELARDIALGADWKRQDLGVAAFVQDRRNGDVLQALAMPVCRPT